jgi:hypothetical protein
MTDESLAQAAEAYVRKEVLGCDANAKLGPDVRRYLDDYCAVFLAGAKHMSREAEALVAALENLNKQTFGQAHAWAGTWTKCECSRVWAFGGNWNECQPAGLCPWCTATKALARFKAARGEHE